MKKYIAILMIVSGLFISAPVSAETIPATKEDLQEQLTLLTQQLIVLLQQQLATLVEQLNAVRAAQVVTDTKVDAVVQNTTPVVIPEPIVTPPTNYGATEPAVVPQLTATCTGAKDGTKYTFTANPAGGTGVYDFYWFGATTGKVLQGCSASFGSNGTMNVTSGCFVGNNPVTYSADPTRNYGVDESVVVRSGNQMTLIQCAL